MSEKIEKINEATATLRDLLNSKKVETVADHLKTLSSNQDIAFMVMQWIAEYAYKYCKDDGEFWAFKHVVATAEFGMQIEKDLGEPYKGSKFDRENKEEKENGEE